ncbi:unnamed protein product [Auanema sp. JU1783]|nr:unnamed protein product [Auanema sp. JU1783]
MSFADAFKDVKSAADIPQELAQCMFAGGGFLILKDFPIGGEFGIDYKSWNVAEKFLGVKMIPPGVHFIYCSVKGTPRIGFFHTFKAGEIVIKRWDTKDEDFANEEASQEEIDRIRANLRNIDRNLGPYPFENYRSWFALTQHVNESTVRRLHPLKGRITAQAELVSMETSIMENQELNENVRASNSVDRENPKRIRFVDTSGLPIMKIREGYEIRFVEFPQLTTTSRVGVDHSQQLCLLLNKLGNDWKKLIEEVEFSFVCFLIGQVFEGFEQWKRFIHLLCCCPSSFATLNDLYIAFIRVLFFQLKECPKDFFIDIVSRDNFLTTTLSMLFANIRDSDIASAELKKKSLQFKTYLTQQFKWDFECDD